MDWEKNRGNGNKKNFKFRKREWKKREWKKFSPNKIYTWVGLGIKNQQRIHIFDRNNKLKNKEGN